MKKEVPDLSQLMEAEIIAMYFECNISIIDAAEELKRRGGDPKDYLAKLDRSYQ